jgi:hypothetical protein
MSGNGSRPVPSTELRILEGLRPDETTNATEEERAGGKKGQDRAERWILILRVRDSVESSYGQAAQQH